MADSTAERSLRESVLDEVERSEARRLVWGLVDGYLSEHELHELVASPLTQALRQAPDLKYLTESEVIADLVADGILHQVPGGTGYRSRMAEAVRLFVSVWPGPVDGVTRECDDGLFVAIHRNGARGARWTESRQTARDRNQSGRANGFVGSGRREISDG
jgi:hypothetical protein